MKIEKKWAMPNKNTFSIKPIKELIEKYNSEEESFLSVDPFANNSKISLMIRYSIRWLEM